MIVIRGAAADAIREARCTNCSLAPARGRGAVYEMTMTYKTAYSVYEGLLADGVAKEVARMVLPVGLYSAQFATCNPRSLMAFLSLRARREGSTFPSYPMREIEMVAELMEVAFAERFPLTYRAFEECGRVSP